MSSLKSVNVTSKVGSKVGPVFSLGYLGSAILANGKTGLGCLQHPLHELYSLYRQFGFRLLQDRRLIISLEGITMLYNEVGIEKYSHNELASVYDAQLIKFFCERKRDKKTYGAFLPVGCESDPKYANLFYPLEKQYSDVFDSLNPALITLIMRKTTGIQALECHVFISRSINEAKTIVDRIHEVCHVYKSSLCKRMNLFQYEPYNETELKNIRVNNQNININDNNEIYVKKASNKNEVTFNKDYLVLQNDNKRRSKSVASFNSSNSVFSKIKANFKSKKSTTEANNSKFERDLKRSSIKSAPDRKPYQSELSLMLNRRHPTNNADNYAVQSSTSTDFNNLSTGVNNFNRDKKVSLPKRVLMSARASIKSSRTSNSNKENATKYGSASSLKDLKDLDFRDPKSVFDQNLLIDCPIPSLPQSRSGSPLSYRSSKYSYKSDIINSKNSLLFKKPLLIDPSNNKKSNKAYLASPSLQRDVSKYLYGETRSIAQNSFSNMSRNAEFNESDEKLTQENLIKLSKNQPHLLSSNHLVWNPCTKTPESLDMTSTQSPIHLQQNNCAKTFSTNGSLKVDEKATQEFMRKEGINSQVSSDIYEIDANKYKYKDSAYNTNSSNEGQEIFEKKYASSYVGQNFNESNASSSIINRIPDVIPYNDIPHNKSPFNSRISNTDAIYQKKIPNFRYQYNNNSDEKQIREKERSSAYNDYIKKPSVSYESNKHDAFHQNRIYATKQDIKDVEIIDLTKCRQENQFINSSKATFNERRNFFDENQSSYRGSIRQQGIEDSKIQKLYLNNEHFGGY